MKRSVQSTITSAPKRSRDPVKRLPPGASLLDCFVSSEEEARLIAQVDKDTWNTSLKRRTQHFGIEYDYKKKWISSDDAATATLPSWCQFLIDRLRERHIISSNPVQLLVNEYEPGQGIARHSDSPAFGDLVLSLSLGSACIMQLRNGEDCIDVPLEPRSLLVLSGEARWKWTHEIPARKSDVIEGGKTARTRRVSLTFRWLGKQPDPNASAAAPPSAPPREKKVIPPHR